MGSLEELVVRVGFGLALFGGIWHAFDRIAPFVSPAAKHQLADWLLHVDVAVKLNRWPAAFLSMFDRVFGERHFTLLCFRRSAYASVAAALVVTLFWASIRPHEFQSFWSGKSSADRNLIVVVLLALNIIPAYVSLLQTRKFIGLLKPESRWLVTSGVIVLDAIAGTAIFFVVGLPLLSGANWVRWYMIAAEAGKDPLETLAQYSPTGTSAGMLIKIYRDLLEALLKSGVYLRTQKSGISLGPFFYSMYFTSIWVWLHALGCLAARHSQHLGHFAGRLRWLFDVENNPVHVVGFFAGVIAALAYWVVAFLVTLAG